ncbi:MAG: glycosyltransferase family 4 protein [Candidatus Diapherotrites archaeon]
MRIFWITTCLGTIGGTEIYTKDLLEELLDRGHEILVYTNAQYNVEGARMERMPVYGHHAFHKFEGPIFSGKALKLAKEFKPELVQSQNNSLMGYIGHRIKKQQKIPHVLLLEVLSSYNFTLHMKVLFETEKFLMPKLNYDKLVVWTSDMKKQYLKFGVPEEKIEIQPGAVNLDNYNLKADGSSIREKYGEHLITSIKSLWSSNAKGIEYVIRAMQYVVPSYPEYKYVIFGWGKNAKDLQELANQLDLKENVILAGPIQHDECEKVAAATEIGPHSLVYEAPTSISLLEYMAWGKACVVTDIGSVKEFVRDSTLLVKPKDPESIAQGIIAFIEDSKLRKEYEKKARALVEQEYTIKKAADRLEKTWEEVSK